MNVTRIRHLENALVHFERNNSISDVPRVSIDTHLKSYYRAHKKKLSIDDKSWISDKFKDLYRWRSLVDHFSRQPTSTSDRLRTYFGNQSWRSYADSKTIAEPIRASMPENLYARLSSHFGKEKTLSLARVWNEKSPTYLRMNPLVDDRDRVVKFLASKGITADKTVVSDLGIRLSSPDVSAALPELEEHVFDMQDESCQLAAKQVAAVPGEKVLDFCCGSGGKSLVMGPSLQGKGHLFLFDVNASFVAQAKSKLRNARIRNFTCVSEQDLRKLKRVMDWVLVDVPSTGSGQYRRYPDRKWLYSDERLAELVETQRKVFAEGLKFMKKNGKIVYSTSSVLPEENLEQVKFFCERHKLFLSMEPVYSLPQSHGMDGFFTAVLERQ